MADDNRQDHEFEFIKNTKGKSAVWAHFSLKRKRDTQEVVEKVAFCDRCHVGVKCGDGTTKARLFLSSGSRERRPYFFENQNKNKSGFNLFYFYFFRRSQFPTAKGNKI